MNIYEEWNRLTPDQQAVLESVILLIQEGLTDELVQLLNAQLVAYYAGQQRKSPSRLARSTRYALVAYAAAPIIPNATTEQCAAQIMQRVQAAYEGRE